MFLGWNDFQKWLAQTVATLPQDTSTGQGRRATALDHDSEELKILKKKKKSCLFIYIESEKMLLKTSFTQNTACIWTAIF